MTAAGERLLEHARDIAQRVASLPKIVGEQELAGEVRIGLPGTVCEILAVPLIVGCRAKFPGIKITIAEAMSGYIRNWLTTGSIDLAILYSTADAVADGIALREVFTEEVCLFAAPELVSRHEGARDFRFRDLASLEPILPGRTHGLRQLVERSADRANMSLNTTIEIDSYGQIKRLAARGLGHGLLPPTAIQREIAEGILVARRIIDPSLERSIFLAWSEERSMNHAIQAVARLAWDTLTNLVSSGAWRATLNGRCGASDIC